MLIALTVWALLPFALLLPGSEGVFNGSTGIAVADDMQYLSWVRDAGQNVLFSSYFDVAPDPHLFLHPMAALSGLAWQLGAGVQLAYLAWKPITILLLLVGFAAYVRRMLGSDRRAGFAALFVALFFFTPATPAVRLLGVDDPQLLFGTDILGLEGFPAGYLWGGLFASVSIALMPLFLLGVERVLEPARRGEHSARAYVAATGAAGLLASWLHPWQGMTLLVILGGLVAWGRFDRRYLSLAVPAGLTLAPLLYYFALSHTDSSWGFASMERSYSHFGWWFLLGIAPALLALPGYWGGPHEDVQERLIRLWPVAGLAVYFGLDQSWFYHALGGLSLPLAILAVRGWRRLHLPRALAVATIFAVTVPGAAYAVSELLETKQEHFFKAGEKQALDYVERSARPGPVLAPYEPLGYAVPAFAGRRTWVGHYNWTPQAQTRDARADALFDGNLEAGDARLLVDESRAAFLISDCRDRADLMRTLGDLVVKRTRFGCATVYEIRDRSSTLGVRR